MELSEQEFRILHQLRYTDDPPACDDGLELLVKFAQTAPSLYELAERVGFVDPVHPGFRTNPRWQAFVEHRAICGKCNEA